MKAAKDIDFEKGCIPVRVGEHSLYVITVDEIIEALKAVGIPMKVVDTK